MMDEYHWLWITNINGRGNIRSKKCPTSRTFYKRQHPGRLSLPQRLGDVEQDLKVKLQELNHVKIENSKIHSRHVELTSSFEKMESDKKILKDELRDIKFRESRMMRDYSELEEENTTMQKHISSLKSSQIEYESLKHENRRLTEEIQYLNSNIDDQVRLREITEKQIEETLQALESEREQKHQLKKQIDQAMLMELEAINNDLENNTSLVEVEETSSMGSPHQLILFSSRWNTRCRQMKKATLIGSPTGLGVCTMRFTALR
ncbi:hypothetical protein BSL78_20137 [Apostichopus japonicus]|uniref:Uncharacterized protein n=1 Tax=Stichopus japonicus TaxID=307972 RepID=A0A2G8K4S9_STIJA|nr:hypothetical protein BSL78_20137 [Apostichopus japonicus]